MSQLFRHIPSVDLLMEGLEQHGDLAAAIPRPLLKDLVNGFLDRLRRDIGQGRVTDPGELGTEALLPVLAAYVRRHSRPHFRRVLNATGVVVHTNLGRSLLAEEAIQAVLEADSRYSNLELDLATGGRGSRYSHVEEILCRLTGAEAALVVNNNAAAVLIMLDTLAKGREVIVSRGQLVEIGGSFRIPEVMERSGALLKEVGATNRTHLRDYERAITSETAALLKVHTSNFRIVGFTKEVPLPELVQLGRQYNLPVIEDLGSGNFTDLTGLGLGHEPTVQEVVAHGVDLVSFSGDKVLGGPQAGIIVGKKQYVDAIKTNPMNRALRIDKMTLAGLEATLRLHLDPELARRRIPTLRMIFMTADELRPRAEELATHVRSELGNRLEATVVSGMSRVGGGAFPERDLPTWMVHLRADGAGPDALKAALLETDPPLIGRIEDQGFCLDLRTLADDEFSLVAEVLSQALDHRAGGQG